MAPGDPVSWTVVERGWRVLGHDGSQLGRVEEVLGSPEDDIFSGIAVSSGVFAKTRVIPSERVATIREGEVVVDVSADDAGQMEEYKPPLLPPPSPR